MHAWGSLRLTSGILVGLLRDRTVWSRLASATTPSVCVYSVVPTASRLTDSEKKASRAGAQSKPVCVYDVFYSEILDLKIKGGSGRGTRG